MRKGRLKKEGAERTKQFNVRLPMWLLDELAGLAYEQHRNSSEMAKLLLRDAIYAAKGWCSCADAKHQNGYGKSGMACWEHGSPAEVLKRREVI